MIKIIDYGHMKVSDLIEGFMEDSSTGQVSSMNGRLNIRPAYQREFVWDKGAEAGGKKQQALVDCCGRAEAILQLLNLYDDLKNGGTEAYGDWLQDLNDLDPGCVRKYTTLTEIDELEIFEPRHPMDYDKISYPLTTSSTTKK